MSGTLIAIPALNEAVTIASVIEEVRAAVPDARVLVVDDGSTDETALIASRHGARVLRLPFNVGVGGAMRSAFRFAAAHDFDCLVQVDADGQHIAAFIPALVEGLDHASVVVGGRFSSDPAVMGEGLYAVPRHRRAAIRLLSATLAVGCGASVRDTTSGFRASDRRAIALFAHHYPAEYLGDTVESLVIAARAGLIVREVPVQMRPRQGGRASQSILRSTLHTGRVVLATAIALTRKPPATPAVCTIPTASMEAARSTPSAVSIATAASMKTTTGPVTLRLPEPDRSAIPQPATAVPLSEREEPVVLA